MSKNAGVSTDYVDVEELIKKQKVKNVPLHLKIDWLAFTIDENRDSKNGEKFYLLKVLGYEIKNFELISGKNFFNSGYGYNNCVKVFYNDPTKAMQKGASTVISYVFTGVGCSNLQGNINNDWVGLFSYLVEFGVKFTRIDICADDWNYPSRVTFPYIERKLARKEFRSSKRRYNLIKDVNTSGQLVGETCYWGSRSTTGKNGHVICRAYQKALQMLGKHEEDAFPDEVKNQALLHDFDGNFNWIRWELEITKAKANSIIYEIVELAKTQQDPIGYAYFRVLRDTIDFIVPTKNKQGQVYKNKSRWKTSPRWLSFLNGLKKMVLENPAAIYNLESVHDWLLYSCMPTIQMLQKIYKSKGLDFFEVMQNTPQREFSKKQKVLMDSSKNISVNELVVYANRFLESREDDE